MITPGRLAEYEAIVAAVSRWARRQSDVEGVAVVGSWARDAATMDSDVDLVVLTDCKARYLEDDAWVRAALPDRSGELVYTEEWGALSERRVRLPSGLEVDFGFADLSWASTDPVDAGTERVVRDGCRSLLDVEGRVERLVAAIGRAGR